VDASGRHCAVGFLRSAKINDSCLQDLLAKHNMPGLVQLNDDYRNRYGFGDSPKERIVAALRLVSLLELLEPIIDPRALPTLPVCPDCEKSFGSVAPVRTRHVPALLRSPDSVVLAAHAQT
jgi:hypothetical protein